MNKEKGNDKNEEKGSAEESDCEKNDGKTAEVNP